MTDSTEYMLVVLDKETDNILLQEFFDEDENYELGDIISWLDCEVNMKDNYYAECYQKNYKPDDMNGIVPANFKHFQRVFGLLATAEVVRPDVVIWRDVYGDVI